MNRDALQQLLEQVAGGSVDPSAAIEKWRSSLSKN